LEFSKISLKFDGQKPNFIEIGIPLFFVSKRVVFETGRIEHHKIRTQLSIEPAKMKSPRVSAMPARARASAADEALAAARRD